jgi:hypothetical protein
MVEALMLKTKEMCTEFLAKEHEKGKVIEDLAPILKSVSSVLTALNMRSGFKGGDGLALEIWKAHRTTGQGLDHILKIYLLPNGDIYQEQFLGHSASKRGMGFDPQKTTLEVVLSAGAEVREIVQNVLKHVSNPDNAWPPFTPDGKN